MELAEDSHASGTSGGNNNNNNVFVRARNILAPLLKQYMGGHPFVTAAQWERAIKLTGDGLMEVSLAEGKSFRINLWGIDLSRTLHTQGLGLVNYTLAPGGRLRLHVREGARWKQGKRKGRDPNSDKVTKLLDKIELMRLEHFPTLPHGEEKHAQHPLAQVQGWLQQEFSDFRSGDRPIDMYLEAHPRGVVVRNLDELRLSDITFLSNSADQLLRNYFIPDAAEQTHIDVFIAPGGKYQHALVSVSTPAATPPSKTE
jgi:hypothetical protein